MYQKILIVGSSQLSLDSIKVIKKYYSGKIEYLNILPIDKKTYNTCKELEIANKYVKKKDLMYLLENINEKTLIFSIMNIYIFPQNIIKNENLTIINLHHGILPGHRGRNATAWAIFYEENKVGITWHIVDEGIDTGKILMVNSFKLSDNDTSIKVMRKQNIVAIESLELLLINLTEEFKKDSNYCLKTDGLINKDNEKTLIEIHSIDYFHKADDIPNKGYLNINWKKNKISAFLRAMDYGVLNVLGKPKIRIADDEYTWKKYKIENCKDIRNENFFDNVNKLYVEDKNIFISTSTSKIELCSITKI
jgi:methionyl-tRNA formyltransferase